uniref:Pentraxin family member n=1 Tax=Oreochromis aureus TaxID=47969 RepID=A0A668W1W2_OREAU
IRIKVTALLLFSTAYYMRSGKAVRLSTSMQSFTAVTACFRSITDLSRNHNLFSLSTPSFHNGFLVFKEAGNNVIDIYVRNNRVTFTGQDYMLNTWQSICTTWDSESELVQLWLNGKPSIKKFIVLIPTLCNLYRSRIPMAGDLTSIMSDVHMWNYVLSPCEIQRFVEDLNFTPGNMINWRALEFEATGRVLVENKITFC